MSGWLLRFDGRPTAGAQLAIVAIVAVAFFAAFVVRASRGTEPVRSAAVPRSRLSGEILSTRERAVAPRLSSAAALPALRRKQARRERSRPRRRETAVITPVVVPRPTPAPTPTPDATPAPATPAPAPPPPTTAAPPAPPADDPPTPDETFDSSG